MRRGLPDAGFLEFAITEKREQMKSADEQGKHRLSTEMAGLERLLQQQESNDHVQSISDRASSKVA